MNYKKNFLSNVICRLDFKQRPAALLSAERSAFTKSIEERYPAIEEIKKVNFSIEFKPGAEKTGGVEQAFLGVQWRHRKVADAMLFVVLDPDYFSIECGQNGFTTFDEFWTEADFVLGALKAAFPDLAFSRAGTRYINQIKLDDGGALDWDNLINAELLRSVLAAVPEPNSLARSMHQVTTLKDDFQTVLNYGIPNPDFPNVVARRHFVLDIDCSKSATIVHDEVPGLFMAMNKRCEQIFESSIENGLREKMEIVND